MNESDNRLYEPRSLTLVPTTSPDPGPGHRHHWELVTSLPGLHAAQIALDWDTAAGRIVAVNKCALCSQLHRGSVRSCSTRHCRLHHACAPPDA
jgi:hypothetical protein